jgi:hypothetical protein
MKPQIVLAVDELAELDEPSFDVLRRIMSLGRAAGISVWAATQRPSADLVPTALRTLLAWLCRLGSSSFRFRRNPWGRVGRLMGWTRRNCRRLVSVGSSAAGDGPRHVKAYDASVPPLHGRRNR